MAECCADVIVPHSPPLFTARGAAQPELSALYKNLLVITQKQQSPLSVRRYNARGVESPARDDRGDGGRGAVPPVPTKPRRPCLVIRTDSSKSVGKDAADSSSSSSDENEPTSPTRRKKKVVFADDRGLSLTHVRLMNEPSNQPPKLMTAGSYLQQQLQSTSVSSGTLQQQQQQQQQVAEQQSQWTVRFSQPASNYLDFRKRLDVGNVSLENVIVKSTERRMLGTVKVRNLSYDKQVFVRYTRDKWATHQDTWCTYVQQNNTILNGGGCGGGSGGASSTSAAAMQNVTAIYDTFSFVLPLPSDATCIEFAVCYKCDEFECWDNNDGNNYCLSCTGGGQSSAAAASTQQPSLLVPSSASALSTSLSLSSSSGLVPQTSVPADFSHLHQKHPVHYFGAQSAGSRFQNSWTPGATWRDQKNDTSACYW